MSKLRYAWKLIKKIWYKVTTKEQVDTEPAPIVVEVPEVDTQLPLPVGVPSEEVGEIADFKFVDSSHHHPYFDATAYTAPFFSNKCTQGLSFVDRTHAPRKKACQENGIAYSGYHFYVCDLDPILQAQFYVKTHGPFTHAPQIDFETTKGQTEADLYADKEDLYKCLMEVKRLTGLTPWLYVNYGAAKRLKFPAKFAEFYAWFARYNSFLGEIPLPWTDKTTGAWQYTEKGEFSGLKGGNDVNIYYGKVNALKLK